MILAPVHPAMLLPVGDVVGSAAGAAWVLLLALGGIAYELARRGL